MNRGGAESMIMNYYRNIDRSKIQFDFLVHRKEKAAFDDEIEQLGGKIYRLNPINPFFPSAYYKQLRGFFKKNNQYTVVHSHLNTFSYFPLKIAEECNIPVRIAHAHIAINKVSFSSVLLGKENLKESLKKIVKLQLKKKISKHTTHPFACGELAGNWLYNSNAPYTIMNNAIDAKKFIYNTAIREAYRNKLALNNSFVLGHVGRFNSQKNHIYLIEIFKEVEKLYSNSKLLLVGDGHLQDTIKKMVKELNLIDKVIFLGTRKDVAEIYQAVDAFVFPSFYEGLPVTLIEAQAAGLPVFVSNTITNEVNLTNLITSLPITTSPKKWAEKIVDYKNFTRQNMYDAIRKENYDIHTNAQKISSFYLSKIEEWES
jgi:glycosyltransferase involved in cell wall biosynthesis